MSRPPEKRAILNLFRPTVGFDLAILPLAMAIAICSEVRDQFNLLVREGPHSVPGAESKQSSPEQKNGPNIGGPTTNNRHGTR